mgnify:CR=1 FL=1
MKKVSFIGCYDKIDLILYIAKILVAMDKKVIVVDSTINQKAKYIVPVIKPTKAYVTEFEGIDVAVGFKNFNEIKEFLNLPLHAELPYDMALLDIDNYESILEFNINNEEKNYFVTGFDLYSLKKGLEILSGITEVLNLTKVFFSKTASKEDDDYLNYLSLGYKITWNEEIVYFPFEVGDQSVIAENQRVAKIKFKKLSDQYKEALIYIAEQILEQDEYPKMKKIFKQLERGI